MLLNISFKRHHQFLLPTVLISLGLLLLDCLAPHHAQADSVTIVADLWCPYNCEPTSDKPGLLIEIARYGLDKGGHTLEYKILPWARAIEEARLGKYEGIVGAYREDAPDFVFPTDSQIRSIDEAYIKANDTWAFTDMKSLEEISIGVIRDYSYGQEVDAYVKKHLDNPSKIQVASGDDALQINVKKLLAGRIRAVIEDRAVMTYYLNQTNKTKEIIPAGILGGQPIFVAFSPKTPKSKEYAALYSQGVTELRNTGKLKEIMKKYSLNPAD